MTQSAKSSTPHERIARRFHEAYESLAPDFSYRTREASAVPWDEVPDNNKLLMIATVERLLDHEEIFTPAAVEAAYEDGLVDGKAAAKHRAEQGR